MYHKYRIENKSLMAALAVCHIIRTYPERAGQYICFMVGATLLYESSYSNGLEQPVYLSIARLEVIKPNVKQYLLSLQDDIAVEGYALLRVSIKLDTFQPGNDKSSVPQVTGELVEILQDCR